MKGDVLGLSPNPFGTLFNNEAMNILIGCEESQAVCIEMRKRGHNAFSCDTMPCSGGHPEWHLQGYVEGRLDGGGFMTEAGEHVIITNWDMLIAFPPCTYLAGSGLHWNGKIEGRAEKTEEALEFVRKLLDCGIPKIALENPVGCIGTRIRKASQTFHPYEFGEDASKRTCLWLKGLPPLVSTKRIPGRIVTYKGKQVERWANQTDSGQNRLGPSKDRATIRSKTYHGVAVQMATQWG